MARTSQRQRPRSNARPTTSKRRRRRPGRRASWYARPPTWAWLLATAALVVGAIVLFRAGDGGEGGSPGSPFVGADLHSLVVAPSAPSRLYVGGHEGVAVSSDGGATWKQVETLDGADAMGWAFDGERLLVGGHPGLYLSEDGGRTFEQRNEGLPATDIHGIGAGDGVIYAASPQVGVFASTDGGRSWEVRTDQVGHSFMGRILVDPADPDRLVTTDMGSGVVESTDGGRTWSVLAGLQGAMWVSWDPADPGHLVAASMGGVAESTDGGRTWDPIEVPEGVSAVEVHPSDPRTLYAAALEGNEARVWVSRDAGASWSDLTTRVS